MESSLCSRRGVSDGGEPQRAFTSEHLHCAVSFCLRMVCSDKPPQARVLPTQRPAQVGAPTHNLGCLKASLGRSVTRSGEFHAHVANKQSNHQHFKTTTDVCCLELKPATTVVRTSMFRMPAIGGTTVGTRYTTHTSTPVNYCQFSGGLLVVVARLACLFWSAVRAQNSFFSRRIYVRVQQYPAVHSSNCIQMLVLSPTAVG